MCSGACLASLRSDDGLWLMVAGHVVGAGLAWVAGDSLGLWLAANLVVWAPIIYLTRRADQERAAHEDGIH